MSDSMATARNSHSKCTLTETIIAYIIHASECIFIRGSSTLPHRMGHLQMFYIKSRKYGRSGENYSVIRLIIIETLVMMSILPASFGLFQISGLWIPSHWHSPILRLLYKLFTILVLFLIYWFVVTGFIELIRSPPNLEEFTDNLFILLTMITVCGKYLNVVTCRESINEMLDILQQDPCSPRDEDEVIIQNKWDRVIWLNTLVYGLLGEVTVFMVTFGTFLQDIPIGTLPFNAWLPYNYSHGIVYWLAYFQQLITLIISAHTAAAYDTLVAGMIMQVSAKLHILKHRFSHLSEVLEFNLVNHGNKLKMNKLEMERKLIADCVECHLTIFKLAEIVNTTFDNVVLLQYGLSAIIICVNVYVVAHINLLSSESVEIILFLCCMLYQIYIYCDAGDEVTLVSSSVSDAIYNMDWTTMDISTVKSLVVIMSRTLRPIIFTSGNLITLSLNSFMSVIKISYSTYNVLQETSS